PRALRGGDRGCARGAARHRQVAPRARARTPARGPGGGPRVSPLEQRLQALGRELEYPSEPDVTEAVLARLDRRPFPWRLVVIAAAVLALAIGAAFAVPQARSAILRFFHLRGASVERVETLPPAVERSRAGGLGRPLHT